jgi:hypothetical protein
MLFFSKTILGKLYSKVGQIVLSYSLAQIVSNQALLNHKSNHQAQAKSEIIFILFFIF